MESSVTQASQQGQKDERPEKTQKEGDENRASLLSSEIAHRLTEENVLVMLTELHLTPKNHFPLLPGSTPNSLVLLIVRF